MKRQQVKFDTTPELQEAVQVTAEDMKSRHFRDWAYHDLILSQPDGSLLEELEEHAKRAPGVSKEDLFRFIQQQRRDDPNFLEPLGEDFGGQLRIVTSGAMYEVARVTASLTGAHLVTDLHVRWKEIELDRAGRTEETQAWSPFAKAFQEAEFRYLDEVSIDDALKLRKEERLDSFRAFLRRVWKQACDIQSFESVNSALLVDELLSEVAKANEEWKQIDRDLIKNAGAAASGVAVSMPMIAQGQGIFVAAAAAIYGAGALTANLWQRHGFADKFPAAFFLRR